MAARVRSLVIDVSKHAGVGHIGSELSIVDLLAVLYGSVLRINDPEDVDRDVFVLSKGHAALALYAVLHLRGWLSEDELYQYCADDSRLGVHPEIGTPGVEVSTGSLGQGLSVATGIALGRAMQSQSGRVYALLSDAECNEGSVWEAVMFAAHHRLANLIAVIDLNGQQALGSTRDILNLAPLAAKWEAFGWSVVEVDGHDANQLQRALTELDAERPRVVIARTTFGRGISFMESQLRWHYFPMSDDDYRQATEELRTG